MNFSNFLTCYLLIVCNQIGLAQAQKPNKASSKTNEILSKKISPPEGIEASDGVSSDYIDIKWQANGGGLTYRVFRSDNPSVIGSEITTKPQVVGFFRDGDRFVLRQGRRYYYRVKANMNKQESDWSVADAGFLKAIAGGHDSTELTTQSTDYQGLELEIRPLERDTFLQGDSINFRYVIVNKGRVPLSNLKVWFQVQARYEFDGNGTGLGEQNIETIPILQIGESHRGSAVFSTRGLHYTDFDLTLWINERNSSRKRSFRIKK